MRCRIINEEIAKRDGRDGNCSPVRFISLSLSLRELFERFSVPKTSFFRVVVECIGAADVTLARSNATHVMAHATVHTTARPVVVFPISPHAVVRPQSQDIAAGDRQTFARF